MKWSVSGNGSTLILIEGHPLCIEWFSVSPETGAHAGEFEEYYTAICDSLFDHADCAPRAFSRNGDCTDVFFIRPADISRHENCNGFSLALDFVGETMFSGSNLVLGTVTYTRDDGGRTIVLELSERLFGLVGMIGKKNLLDAVKDGLVLQRPQGLRRRAG